MAEFGCIRVSAREQNENRQRLALERQAIPPANIFVDNMSGKDFRRLQYQALLRTLRQGDLLCIPSIDRLERSYEEILEQWRLLTREMRVDILVPDMRRKKNCSGRSSPSLFCRSFPLWQQVPVEAQVGLSGMIAKGQGRRTLTGRIAQISRFGGEGLPERLNPRAGVYAGR